MDNKVLLQACFSIVPNEELMSTDAIVAEKHSYTSLFHTLSDDWTTLQWCARRRLLANTSFCECCRSTRSLIQQSSLDSFVWRCAKCRKTKSIRQGSCFNRSHLTLRKVMLIFYAWANDWPHSRIEKETNCSGNAVVGWYNFCRDVCETWLEIRSTPIGGIGSDLQPKIVVVDESNYFSRRYGRGDWLANHWVFGGIELGSSRCFLVEAADRSDETIRRLIKEWILPGTHIISSGWSAFKDLNTWGDYQYTHETIIVPRMLKHRNHLQVRSKKGHELWTQLRRKIPQQLGTNHHIASSYLHELLWKNSITNRESIFEHLIVAITSVYDHDPDIAFA